MFTDVTNQQAEREKHLLQAYQEELVEHIGSAVHEDGVVQPLNGLYLGRFSVVQLHRKVPGVLKPSLCVIAQGSKEVWLGDKRYQYDPFHYLLATLELPYVSQVLEASKEHPYLSLLLELDPQLVSSVMLEVDYELSPPHLMDVGAVDVSPLDTNLLETIVRLVRLLGSSEDARILMPIITREIIYRLLKSTQVTRLRHLAISGGNTSYIAKAVERLRKDFDKPLRIEQLARELGMSVSGFHYHFKAVTALSPFQFQKQLRLQEARRLMLSENLDAASAAYRVGYKDASHFNREYKSVFGVPPMRDIQQLREAANTFPS